MLNRLDLAEDELQESFMYSLLWNYRNGKGVYICHSRASLLQIIILMCGDIETCPGPIRCSVCSKSVSKAE
jgi:hypothetical protein